jgi:hypothetical protein
MIPLPEPRNTRPIHVHISLDVLILVWLNNRGYNSSTLTESILDMHTDPSSHHGTPNLVPLKRQLRH